MQHWIVNFTGQQSITFQTNYTILTEGVWRLWAVRCAADGNAVGPTITLTGNATWLNPYGQIPGSIFAFIPVLNKLFFHKLKIKLLPFYKSSTLYFPLFMLF